MGPGQLPRGFSFKFSEFKHNLHLLDINSKIFDQISPVHNVSIFVAIEDFRQLSKFSNCLYRAQARR